MWPAFNTKSSDNNVSRLSPAEQTLKNLGIKYKRQRDGRLRVPGNISLCGKRLTELPDLSGVIVEGYFSCGDNELTSLKGAPAEVRGGFFCYKNRLTSLEHCPSSVGGDFQCGDNLIASLEHAPVSVNGFYAKKNMLTSLEHAPRIVTGTFDCAENMLTTLEHAPKAVGGFDCKENPLTSLEFAPDKFDCLCSDFGNFFDGVIPDHLRVSPETPARLEREERARREAAAQALEMIVRGATVLSEPLRVSKPYRFKTGL